MGSDMVNLLAGGYTRSVQFQRLLHGSACNCTSVRLSAGNGGRPCSDRGKRRVVFSEDGLVGPRRNRRHRSQRPGRGGGQAATGAAAASGGRRPVGAATGQ